MAMNKSQKLVQQKYIGNEDAVLWKLERAYSKAFRQISDRAKALEDDVNALYSQFMNSTDMAEKVNLMSLMRSKVYQKEYQNALKHQIQSILETMQLEDFQSVDEYLKTCYEDGFIGTFYDIHQQGIPLVTPINQEQMVRAVQLESKIKADLYTSMGEKIPVLKEKIAGAVSRGIATGRNYEATARELAGLTKIGYNNAVRIARTEGHRIQAQAAMDACEYAQDRGADIVKQWDATLDKRTRPSHQMVDGEVRELNEPFSNGLMFPGDPDGGPAEVINCRCALLQRARWALDEEELEELKDRAAYYGLDKTQNFEDFKQKYIDVTQPATPAPPPAPPKKEYLTKKKLEEKIAEIEKLEKQTKDPQMLKDLQAQKADFQDKLDKKLADAEKKKLKKEKILLEDQLNNYPIETYSGIWKDDVTTLDWFDKQGGVAGKKSYFENKMLYATGADKQKWQDLWNAVDDFDQKGSEYYKIKQALDKVDADLTYIKKNGKLPKIDDAFSQARKDAALWFDKAHGGFAAADAYFDPPAIKIHNSATYQERDGFYTYTSGSGGHNRPLAGFQKPWGNGWDSGWEEKYKVGPKKVWIDYEGKGDQIRGLTTLIEKSTYDKDVWIQSGQDFATVEGFLGISYGTLSSMSDTQLQQFVGRRNVIYNFISGAVNEGGGSMFNSKPLKLNIYCPKGTEMLYASSGGAFGKGENEMIFQRGGTYEITKIYWGNDATDYNKRKIFVDMEVHPEVGYDKFQQDPNEWKGSKKNYMNP